MDIRGDTCHMNGDCDRSCFARTHDWCDFGKLCFVLRLSDHVQPFLPFI